MFKKRNLIFLSLLILGVLLLTSCFLNPPVTEGILKGQVLVPEGTLGKDLTGQVLPDATVNIIDLSTGSIIATTVTDATGYYQVSVPPGGPYLLEAVKDGVKLEQITCSVEVGMEYDLGTADCSTTAVALIVQAMLDAEDYPNDPADINLADIEADPDFDDVMNPVCSTIEAGGDPAESAVVQQAVEDFLYPPAPAPPTTPAPTPVQETPTFNPPAGPIAFGTTVTITSAGADAIYYTTNGSDPTTASTNQATTPLVINAAVTVKAIAVKAGSDNSAIASAAYTQAATADLTGLALSGSPDNYTFAASTYTYNGVTVANGITSIIVTPTGAGTITVNGTEVTSGSASDPIALTAGTEKTITVVATETGKTAKTYTIKITRRAAIAVGDSYGGGIVAYILQPGEFNGVYNYDENVQHGLIAATDDQSEGIQWYNGNNTTTGAIGTALGTGSGNTTTIIGSQGATATNYAAGLARDYNGGGYTDWFLPSKDELDKLYINRVEIGGFTGHYYWSSSEYDASHAWGQFFSSGAPNLGFKFGGERVRAVRAF